MAIYNSGYPATYQNPYLLPQYSPMQQPTQNTNGIIWVQGEAGAKSYLVAPNTTVQLWDSESQRIYLKSADASGMPSMKVLDYTIQCGANAPVSAPDAAAQYATKEELEALTGQINGLKTQLDKMKERRRRIEEDDYDD